MIDNGNHKYDVLLVEDDLITGEAIASTIECYEFKVRHVTTGKECLNAIAQTTPAMVLLDLYLPDQPGHEVCKKIREGPHKLLPIIGLSGSQDDSDVVRLLESGADDFVGKKRSVEILIAHMRSALKRLERYKGSAMSSDTLSWGEIQVDRISWKVTVAGKEVSLTPTEFRLLETFLLSPGAVFTRDQLIARIRGSGYAITPRMIDVHINGLRKNLGTHRDELETVRGIGYRLR